MRLNLRKVRLCLILYVLFDLYIGGHCAGLFPLGNMAAAQFTQVTGTVTDPTGLPYANGTISAGLVLTGAGSPTLNGLAYTPPSQPSGLDLNGHFVMSLADNTQISPAGTKWNFLVCSAAGTVQPVAGKGPVCFSLATPITISGTSQDISSNLNAVALPLQNPQTGAVTLGSATITGTLTVPAGSNFCNSGLKFVATNPTCFFLSGGGAFASQSAIGYGMNTNLGWFFGLNTSAHALLAAAGTLSSIGFTSSGQPTSLAVDATIDEPAAGIIGIGNTATGSDINGRLAVARIGSDVGSNTDSFIKLAFSAATTATYTFAGSYTNAPICVIAPVAPGATTFTITTDSTTTLTVTASVAFTGTVNAICGLQN